MALPRINPMQLILLPEPFDHPEWIFELKHDGFRCVAYVPDGKCRLVSRRGNVYSSIKNLQLELASLRVKDAIIDGEIVCLDSDGHSLFYELLRRKGRPVLYGFDLLYLNGEDLRQQPLIERKRKLHGLIKAAKKKCPNLLYARHVDARGNDLFRLVCASNSEGVVAKRRIGLYGISERWFKIRNRQYSQMEGRRELFDSFKLHKRPVAIAVSRRA